MFKFEDFGGGVAASADEMQGVVYGEVVRGAVGVFEGEGKVERVANGEDGGSQG